MCVGSCEYNWVSVTGGYGRCTNSDNCNGLYNGDNVPLNHIDVNDNRRCTLNCSNNRKLIYS